MGLKRTAEARGKALKQFAGQKASQQLAVPGPALSSSVTGVPKTPRDAIHPRPEHPHFALKKEVFENNAEIF